LTSNFSWSKHIGDQQSLVEAMRVSSVQQVATTLAQELKDYRFGLEESFREPRDLQLSVNMLLHGKNSVRTCSMADRFHELKST
jgi:hypothetical protein